MEESQRPRERLIEGGPSALSDAELLAVLLRTGRRGRGALALAHELLRETSGLAGLARRDFAQLTAWPGLGKAKATSLCAAIELGRRLAVAELRRTEALNRPDAAGRLLIGYMRRLRREVFGFLSLDTRCRLLKINEVSHGTRKRTPVDPADVFRMALLDGASSVLVFHNHPSGDVAPSRSDLELTGRLVDSGRVIGIPVNDHLIVANGAFSSLRCRHPNLFGGAGDRLGMVAPESGPG
jgi:DNA repair protein RadC